MLSNLDLAGDFIEIVELTEDCVENCSRLAKAATSKAAAVDLSDVLAEVSTYITAPHCSAVAIAC